MKVTTLKKTRRIEITAIRLTTTVFGAESDDGVGDQPASRSDVTRSGCEDSAQCIETDPLGTLLSSVDDAISAEFAGLIEALVVSEVGAARAAQQAGPSRHRFYAKLRALGFSIKHLKTGLKSRRKRRIGI